jgi:peptide/nickel transport system substrate-binding protein
MYAAINAQQEILSNPLVRQALNYAVDRESMVDIALDGLGAPAYAIANPSVIIGASEPSSPYAYDPEMAKQLLTEAGYPDGLDIGTISAIPFGGADKLAEILQQNLADVGVTSSVELGEFVSIITDMESGNFDLVSLGNAGGYDFQGYQLMYGTGMPNNPSGLSNPEIDSLFAQAAMEVDLASREAINQQIIDLATSDAIYIPFVYPISPVAWNADLKVDQVFVYFLVKYMHWD